MAKPLITTNRLQPGTIIEARYEVTGYLGSGGFAQVYSGHMLSNGAPVAIKLMHPREGAPTDPTFTERFIQEAQLAAQIQHPCVVAVYEYGFSGERPYIIMEHLRGHDLGKEFKKEQPMGPARIIKLVSGVLEALGEGHRKGIVHKDLKPANLYLHMPGTHEERLTVLDFGIARMDQGESHLTTTGQLMGTPKYYAPEYIKTQTVTPSLDVYQMGLIIVEMFTRKPVVDMDDPYLCLMKHSMGQLDLPQSLISSPLGPVLRKALALEHTDRYSDANEFLHALRQLNPATISPVQAGDPVCQLNEISGNHQSFAAPPGSSSQTGPHSAPGNTGPLGVAHLSGKNSSISSGRARISIGARKRSTGSHKALARRAPKGAQPRSRTRLMVTVGVTVAISVLIGLGLTAAFYIKNNEAVEPPHTDTKNNDPNQNKTLTKDTKGPIEDDVDFIMVPADAITVTIDSNVPGADVFKGSDKIGQTPMEYTFDSDTADAIVLTISAADHQAQIVEVSPSNRPKLSVTLDARNKPKGDKRSNGSNGSNDKRRNTSPSNQPPPGKETRTNNKKNNAGSKKDNGGKKNNNGGQKNGNGGGFVMPSLE